MFDVESLYTQRLIKNKINVKTKVIDKKCSCLRLVISQSSERGIMGNCLAFSQIVLLNS